MKKVLLLLALVGSVGCQGFQSQITPEQSAMLSEVSGGHKIGLTDKPYCEVDTVDYELDTHLIAFEMTDSTNVSVGFNLIDHLVKAVGLNLKLERAQMLLSMHMSEALRPTETIVDVMGRGDATKTDLGAGIDMGKIGLDVNYIYQTPLSKLTQRTIRNSLEQLKKKVTPIETAWRSHVVYTYPVAGQLIIPAGTVAGVRMGDKFQVYNVDYVWKGEPCSSELLFETKKSTTPVAILQVVQLEKNAALLNIIDKGSDEPIDLGSLVEVYSLPLAKKEKSRSLARAVRLRSFESEKLMLESGKDIDLTVYLAEQTRALLASFGYYPRQ